MRLLLFLSSADASSMVRPSEESSNQSRPSASEAPASPPDIEPVRRSELLDFPLSSDDASPPMVAKWIKEILGVDSLLGQRLSISKLLEVHCKLPDICLLPFINEQRSNQCVTWMDAGKAIELDLALLVSTLARDLVKVEPDWQQHGFAVLN